MKILVAVKRVLDYNIKVRVKSDHSDVDLTNLKMSINPFDEIAVEEAVRLKENGKVNDIIAASIGPDQVHETLRTAMALGADRAIHVRSNSDIEPLNVAKILKAIVEREQVDLVIMGKQAIDNDCNQTAQMLAGLLDWSQATFISKLKIDGQTLTVTREVDGGLETLSCQIPCILSTDLRLNVPRFPKLPNIMKAKQKPIESIDSASLGIDLKPRHTLLQVVEPPVRKTGIKVANVNELVQKLMNEAKVI